VWVRKVADRQVDLEFVFDRLGDAQLIQAYRLLVPERRNLNTEAKRDDTTGGDLLEGFLRTAEGGTDRS